MIKRLFLLIASLIGFDRKLVKGSGYVEQTNIRLLSIWVFGLAILTSLHQLFYFESWSFFKYFLAFTAFWTVILVYYLCFRRLSFAKDDGIGRVSVRLILAFALGFLLFMQALPFAFEEVIKHEADRSELALLGSQRNSLREVYRAGQAEADLLSIIDVRDRQLTVIDHANPRVEIEINNLRNQLKREDSLLTLIGQRYQSQRVKRETIMEGLPKMTDDTLRILNLTEVRPMPEYQEYLSLFEETKDIRYDNADEDGWLTKNLKDQQQTVDQLRSEISKRLRLEDSYAFTDSLYYVFRQRKTTADSLYLKAIARDSIELINTEYSRWEEFGFLDTALNRVGGFSPYYPYIVMTLGGLFFIIPVLAVYYNRKGKYNELLIDAKWQEDMAYKFQSDQLKLVHGADLNRLERINWIKPDRYAGMLIAESRIAINEITHALEIYRDLQDRFPYDKTIVKRAEEAYKLAGNERKILQDANKSFLKNEQAAFESNLRKSFALSMIEIKNVSSFQEILWQPQPHINLVLGKNGFGKTYVLRLIAAMLQSNEEVKNEYEFATSQGTALLRVVNDNNSKEIRANDQYLVSDIGKIPVLAISDQRFLDRSNSQIWTTGNDHLEIPHDSAYHFIHQKPYDASIQEFLYGLCIEYLDSNKKFDSWRFEMLADVMEELTGTRLVFENVNTKYAPRFVLEVKVEGSNEVLPIQKTSQGSLSVLIIFGMIYDYLKKLPDQFDKERLRSNQKHAVVIIDEIDAHLHPSWQGKIVSLLHRTFPNVQFIITAHNPAIVAGRRRGEVSVFKKDSKSKLFVLEQILDQDFIGVRTDEIYRRVFEIEDKDESRTDGLYDAFWEDEDVEEYDHLGLDDTALKECLYEKNILELESKIDELNSIIESQRQS